MFMDTQWFVLAIIFLNTKLFHKNYVYDFSSFVIQLVTVDDVYVFIETKLIRYKLNFVIQHIYIFQIPEVWPKIGTLLK